MEYKDTRAVLRSKDLSNYMNIRQLKPAAELGSFIEHYWSVQWNLPEGKSFEQKVLPYPSVHIAAEEGSVSVHGVVTGIFSKKLTGNGEVFGIKFLPGGFRPFCSGSVSDFTDSVLPLDSFIAGTGYKQKPLFLNREDFVTRAGYADEFLIQWLPKGITLPDVIPQAFSILKSNDDVIRPDHLARKLQISLRSLQRIFREWVGVSPRWIIMRERLQNIAAILAETDTADWSTIAADAGYFDQAHFINDFRSVIGMTPGEYLQSGKEDDRDKNRR